MRAMTRHRQPHRGPEAPRLPRRSPQAPHRLLAAAVSVGLLLGCEYQPLPKPEAPEAFTFRMTAEQPVTMSVSRQGEPLQGAIVNVYALHPTDESRDNLMYRGRSQKRGELKTVVAPLGHTEKVRVVVHAPGMRGPYTDESLRTALGPVAPASVQILSVSELATLNINLEPMGGTE